MNAEVSYLKRKTSAIITTFLLTAVISISNLVPAYAATKVVRTGKNLATWAQEQRAAEEAEAAAKKAAEDEANAAQNLRQNVVDFALSFVGGPYRYGGTNPYSGTDCSGFTRYVLENAAGVSVGRTSRDQAGEGTRIGADAIQPGDLVFYGGSGSINHVAMYIGNGQVVSAANEKYGIRVTNMNYRTPVRIVNVLG